MAKKSHRQLEAEIDAFIRHERVGPRELAPLPKWDDKLRAWVGGDKRTLYAWTMVDPSGETRVIVVQPGTGTLGKAGIHSGIGGGVKLRGIATHAEAEEHWQSPLHVGWNVK